METAQKKTSEAQIRANKKYANSKWRPAIYLNLDKREIVENHFLNKGFKTFNEYVNDLISKDLKSNDDW